MLNSVSATEETIEANRMLERREDGALGLPLGLRLRGEVQTKTEKGNLAKRKTN